MFGVAHEGPAPTGGAGAGVGLRAWPARDTGAPPSAPSPTGSPPPPARGPRAVETNGRPLRASGRFSRCRGHPRRGRNAWDPALGSQARTRTRSRRPPHRTSPPAAGAPWVRISASAPRPSRRSLQAADRVRSAPARGSGAPGRTGPARVRARLRGPWRASDPPAGEGCGSRAWPRGGARPERCRAHRALVPLRPHQVTPGFGAPGGRCCSRKPEKRPVGQ